jgi:hypothetical protein
LAASPARLRGRRWVGQNFLRTYLRYASGPMRAVRACPADAESVPEAHQTGSWKVVKGLLSQTLATRSQLDYSEFTHWNQSFQRVTVRGVDAPPGHSISTARLIHASPFAGAT